MRKVVSLRTAVGGIVSLAASGCCDDDDDAAGAGAEREHKGVSGRVR